MRFCYQNQDSQNKYPVYSRCIEMNLGKDILLIREFRTMQNKSNSVMRMHRLSHRCMSEFLNGIQNTMIIIRSTSNVFLFLFFRLSFFRSQIVHRPGCVSMIICCKTMRPNGRITPTPLKQGSFIIRLPKLCSDLGVNSKAIFFIRNFFFK